MYDFVISLTTAFNAKSVLRFLEENDCFDCAEVYDAYQCILADNEVSTSEELY
jgi:hypothetical protein|tara:strand:- start:354 stop:512 length:159 start_codon:yes stop_codon:yes gene_type:complete